MNAPEATREALMDAWAITGKPDWMWETYSRTAMGTQMSETDLFVGTIDAAKRHATSIGHDAHEKGYDEGHDDGMARGERIGVLKVMAELSDGKWPELAAQVAVKWPELWTQAICDRVTRDGDGS